MNKATPENQIAYYKEHPPECLVDFISQPYWIDNIEYDGHGFTGIYPDGLIANPNIVFAVTCKCGNNSHRIIAESEQEEIWYHEGLVMAEKYFLECSSCHSRRLLFNPSMHGYNAVISQMEGLDLSESPGMDSQSRKDEVVTCECFNCHKTEFEVFVRFEYPADLFDDPDLKGKEQELFSWFTGLGNCKACSTLNQFMDFECA